MIYQDLLWALLLISIVCFAIIDMRKNRSETQQNRTWLITFGWMLLRAVTIVFLVILLGMVVMVLLLTQSPLAS